MERIKEAIQKARQQRERVVFPIASPGGGANAGQPIEYTCTRVVDIPAGAWRAHRAVTTGPEADVYRMLRTKVLHRMAAAGWNTLAITSPNAGEGKTLTAVNLSISLAMDVNHTVLLVDLDLRRPMVHTYFGYQPDKGIGDYVTGQAPIESLLFNPSRERLVVLPGRDSLANSSEILSSPEVVRLADELKRRYRDRIVVFDLPPVLSSDDALAFSPNVDAVLLVAQERATQREHLLRASQILAQSNVIGTVLNKSAEANGAYY